MSLQSLGITRTNSSTDLVPKEGDEEEAVAASDLREDGFAGQLGVAGRGIPLQYSYMPVWTREPAGSKSLEEFHGSVHVPDEGGPVSWRKLAAYFGPGLLVAVGYMDPGNWSTDIAGGSGFGYSLLFVVSVSSLMAMFLQALALKCGLVARRDLAQCCRDSYPWPVCYLLWFIAECAIIATDLAEVIGSAIALKLLFQLPLIAGVALTAVDVLLFLFLIGRSIKVIEAVVGCLILLITVCFCVQMSMSKPPAIPLLLGFLPSEQIFNDPGCLFVAVGIIGATVMPHNLFLHSSIVLTRSISLDAGTADAAGAAGTGNDDPRNKEGLKEALKYAFWDSTVSLSFAWFVNSSILIVAASAFHKHGYTDIVDLEDAYKLLTPVLGNSAGAYLFAIALLASGQNATLTGTLTGQIVMEGFTSYHVQPFTRRVATRLLAIVPAVIAVSVGGDGSANNLLIFSQVFLSFALPFAIFPLVHITSDAAKMGEFVNGRWTAVAAYLIGLLILSLNVLVFIPR